MEHIILVVLTNSVGNIAKVDDIENFDEKEDMECGIPFFNDFRIV